MKNICNQKVNDTLIEDMRHDAQCLSHSFNFLLGFSFHILQVIYQCLYWIISMYFFSVLSICSEIISLELFQICTIYYLFQPLLPNSFPWIAQYISILLSIVRFTTFNLIPSNFLQRLFLPEFVASKKAISIYFLNASRLHSKKYLLYGDCYQLTCKHVIFFCLLQSTGMLVVDGVLKVTFSFKILLFP